jgi:acyl-CoA synthetase (NDP forming)
VKPYSSDALAALLRPRSVAVIGASSDSSGFAGQSMRVILEHTCPENFYLVNPRRDEIEGIQCYPDIGSVPSPVDLAVLTVPAATVADRLRECAKVGVTAAYVISAGFAESGTPEGRQYNDDVLDVLSEYPIRVGGPNGEGIYDLHSDFAFGFSPVVSYKAGLARRPHAGNVAIVSQSGGAGYGLFSSGLVRGIGFSRVVSTGNEMDIDALQYVQYCLECDDTDVVFLYIEGFSTPGQVAEICREALRRDKALVVMKAGRSETTQIAMQSHTGHIAGPNELYSALFARYGVAEVRDTAEALDVMSALSRYRNASGRHAAVVSGSGGSGLWLAEALEDGGVEVPAFDAAEQAAILHAVPEAASVRNPVDATAAGSRDPARTADLLAAVAGFDSVDVTFYALSLTHAAGVMDRLKPLLDASDRTTKPIIAFCHYHPVPEAVDRMAELGILWFTSQLGAARGVMAMANHARASRLADAAPDSVVEPLAASDYGTEQALKQTLHQRGFAVPAGRAVATPDEAVAAFQAIGTKVAMKLQAADLHHKSDVGGVVLNVASPEQARDVFDRLIALRPGDGNYVLVEEMASPGREMLVGGLVDPDLGPFILISAGGIDADLGLDKVISPAPVHRDEAVEMIRSLASFPAMGEWRGAPPRDIDALADVLVNVSRLVAASSQQLRELELNPVIVHAKGEGLQIVDALAIAAPTLLTQTGLPQ